MTKRTAFLGVGAGAASFKAVALASMLTKHALRVRVLLTEDATAFVTPLSFSAVTGEPCVVSPKAVDSDGVASHLKPADADVFVVAPATADLIAKLAHGHASDAVSLGALSAPDRRFFCPAMNDRMWTNAFVQENAARLQRAGWHQIGPVEGRLAEGYEAVGRMSEPEEILQVVLDSLG